MYVWAGFVKNRWRRPRVWGVRAGRDTLFHRLDWSAALARLERRWIAGSETGCFIPRYKLEVGSVKARSVAIVPLGRIQQPDDVANLVVFLASSDASYITGQAVNVSGGLLNYISSPFHKFGHVYLDLEARWTIANFGHGMPCPYISRRPTDL